MSTMPHTLDGLIHFFEDHTAIWINDPEGIGLTAPQVAALSGATVAARSAMTVATGLREQSKAGTTALNTAIRELRSLGGPAISAIRAFAEGSDSPGAIYAAAQIPPRAEPSPAPPPAIPTEPSATVLGEGGIRLRWKAPQPAPGAEIFTQIRRRLNGAGQFQTLGDTGAKTFVDDTVPAGTHKVEYTFIAKRGEEASDPTQPIALLLGVPGNVDEGEGGLSLAA